MWLIVAALFLIPVFAAFAPCFQGGPGAFPESLRALADTALSPAFTGALRFTVVQAALSAILSIALAVPAAYLLYVRPGPGSRAARITRNAVLMPFVLPGVLVVLSLMLVYGRNGYLSRFLASVDPGFEGFTFLYGMGGVLLTHVFYNISLGVRLVGGAWERLEGRLYEAARTLGASGPVAFLTVVWPLLAPSVWYAALLTFVYSALSFAPVLIFGGGLLKTVEVAIYTASNVSFDLPEASRMALLQTIPMALLALAGTGIRWRSSGLSEAFSSRAGSRGPGGQGAVPRLFGWAYLSLLALFSLAPVLGLLARGAMDPRGFQALASGGNLGSLGVSLPSVLGFSAASAGATAIITLVLSYLCASGNGKGMGKPLRELVFILPLMVSPITLALGARTVLGALPPLVGIVSYQVLVAFPVVYPMVQTALESFNPAYTEAASMLGASRFRALLTVRIPVLRTGFVSALLYGAAISLGDFVGVLLLGGGGVVNLPVAIYRLMGHYNFPQATAIGSVLGLTVLAFFYLIDAFSGGDRGGDDDAAVG